MSNWYREYVCSGARDSGTQNDGWASQLVVASHPASREIIRRIFRLADAGCGAAVIARQLNESDTPARNVREE